MRSAALTLALALVLTALPAEAASVIRTYNYFPIGGSTLAEIETELSRRGPQLYGEGRRHPGATRMEFTSRVGYAQTEKGCRIAEARVTLKARVILPRWRKRSSADVDTRLIWDTLASDIRRHEESHIVIARNHAMMLEKALMAIAPRPDCRQTQARAREVTAEILARHDEEQARFDRIESINFENRLMRLLRYRLERQGAGAG
jgi:predicted secreted Zn-dependent protease